MKKTFIISTITTVLIMIIIFSFSAQSREQSTIVSQGLSKKIADIISIFIKMSESEKIDFAKSIHALVRKLAHFSIYCALGISSSTMFFSYFKGNLKKATIFIVSTLFCCLYAASDEIHQIFSAGRGPMVTDVLLDTFGAMVGSVIFLIILNIITSKHKKEKSYD